MRRAMTARIGPRLELAHLRRGLNTAIARQRDLSRDATRNIALRSSSYMPLRLLEVRHLP